MKGNQVIPVSLPELSKEVIWLGGFALYSLSMFLIGGISSGIINPKKWLKMALRNPNLSFPAEVSLEDRKPPNAASGTPVPKTSTIARRIAWNLKERKAKAQFTREESATKFVWSQKAEEFDSITWKDKPVKEPWRLLWDGLIIENFQTEAETKCYIIRSVYSLSPRYLIPSELLADANLLYVAGEWVDEWNCTEERGTIIESRNLKGVYRPAFRKIVLPFQGGLSLVGSGYATHKHKIIRNGVISKEYLYVPPPEIPDEECFYTFKTGGFYDEGKVQTSPKTKQT